MNPTENPSPDNQESQRTLAEEKRTLTEKLVRALKENSTLHDRLAELQITMNIKTAELQKEIDILTREREDLLEENEALLRDVSLKEAASGTFPQALPETRGTMEEMQRQLDAGKQHLEEFELKYIALESRYRAILKEKESLKATAEEQEDRLLALMHERERAEKARPESVDAQKLPTDAIAAKNEEVEKYKARIRELLDVSNEAEGLRAEVSNLREDTEGLRRLNESLEEEKKRIEKESQQTRTELSTLEDELSAKDESIRGLRQEIFRLEGTIASAGKTKEGFFERLRSKSPISATNNALSEKIQLLSEALEKEESIRAELEDALKQKDSALGELSRSHDLAQRRISADKEDLQNEVTRLRGEIEGLLLETSYREKSLPSLEEKLAEYREILDQRERDIQRLSGELSAFREEHELHVSRSQSDKDALVQELRAKELDLQSHVDSVADLERQLAEARQLISSHEDILSEKERSLAKLTDTLAAYEQQLEEKRLLSEHLESGKNALEQALHTKDLDLKAHADRAADFDERLAKAQQSISSLECTLSEKEQSLAKLTHNLASSERQTEEWRALTESLQSEKDALSQALHAKEIELKAHADKAADLETRLANAQQLISAHEGTLSEKEQSLAKVSHSLAAYERQLEEKKLLGEALQSEKDALSQILQAKELDLKAYANKATDLETQLIEAQQVISAHESAISEKEQSLARLADKLVAHERQIEEKRLLTEQLQSEKNALEQALHTKDIDLKAHADKAAALETHLAEARQVISSLEKTLFEREQSLAESGNLLEQKEKTMKALTGEFSALQDQYTFRCAANEKEKKDLTEILRAKQNELAVREEKMGDLETRLLEARQTIADLWGTISEKERTLGELRRSLTERERLVAERRGHIEERAEVLKETDHLQNLRAVISGEITKLKEEHEKLLVENETQRNRLQGDFEAAISEVTRNAERLEHTISEGKSLAKKIEDLSTGMVAVESLPVSVPAPSSAWTQEAKPGEKNVLKKMTVAAALVILGLILGGIIFSDKLQRAWHIARTGKGDLLSSGIAGPWTKGTKLIEGGGYAVRVIFLTKESVGVLGLSDKITDANLAENHYAVIEIRAEGTCIPKNFIDFFEKKISFIDARGNIVPLNPPGLLETEKRAVYTSKGCTEETGAVYLKGIISAAITPGIQGISISDLQRGSPLLVK